MVQLIKLLMIANIGIIFTLLISVPCNSIVVHEDVHISPEERIALDLFRKYVGDLIKADWMKMDVFLVKWLRASKLNVKLAAENIRKTLKWREEENIDNILDEDFKDFELDFPYTFDATDYDGRPVGAANIAEWDVRRIVLHGKLDRGIRFLYKNAEIAAIKVVDSYKKGNNVTTGIGILNLDGFNTVQHACSRCLPLFDALITTMDERYPGMIYKLFGINTPMSFYPVFRTYAAMLSQQTRDTIRLYGTNKQQWLPMILNRISADQLEPPFGGTKVVQNVTSSSENEYFQLDS